LTYPGLNTTSVDKINKYIKDCTFSLEAQKSPVPFKPINMGSAINTKEDEYLPVITADEEMIIFTRQENSNEDFFKSVKRNGEWSVAEFLSKEINTSNFNEGAQNISPDGNYLFFTGCNRPDGLGCDIYISKREGNDWSKPFNIGGPVNTAGWESQPSISADGRTLYFVSTRQGGYGGYDIWSSELNTDGTWSNPINLGQEINTSFDEQSPFIHPDNESLYFSSNGWPGLGNKDLFLSRKAYAISSTTGATTSISSSAVRTTSRTSCRCRCRCLSTTITVSSTSRSRRGSSSNSTTGCICRRTATTISRSQCCKRYNSIRKNTIFY
jgi:Tol biopolymer transport system component